MSLFISSATTKGIIREENQDILFVGDRIVSDEENYTNNFDKEFVRLALADGMGGHIGGKQAAMVAIETTQKIENGKIGEDIVKIINKKLGLINQGKKIRECMGTTLCIMTIKNNTIYWDSVGDSCIYIINKDIIRRVNKLDEVLDRYGTRTGIIDNCLGASNKFEPVKIHNGKEFLKKDDFCLCVSDGVSGFLSDDEIHKLVISEEINNICNKIITKSIEAKSTDNISAILTKYIAKTD